MRISIFERLRKSFRESEYRFMMLIAAVIGVLGGLGAVVFRQLITFVQSIGYAGDEYHITLFERLEWWHVVLVPMAGGALIGPIVHYFARETKGHGVPEVMEAVAMKQGVIRKRIVAAKTLASAISIGTGGSVGREGPIVQIGSAIGSALGQILKVSRTKLKTMVGCGAAAGVAATFNAPVAGVFFSLEVILGDFGIRRFTPIVISSVIATAVSHHFMGNEPAFVINVEYELVSSFELISYSLLGVAAGFVALLFSWMVYFSEDLFEKLKIPALSKPILGGMLIGLMGLQFPHVFGVGYETIEMALNQELALGLLFLLVAVKLLATSLTLGSGGSGGIFAPSLFLGAVLGGGLGSLFHNLLPNYTASSGAYALVGMGAVVAAATHAPLTSIMIIFEMTGDYKIILPLMFACIIGNVLASKMNPESIYTKKLARRGFNIRRGRDVNVLASLRVKSILSQEFLTIQESMPLGIIFQKVVKYPFSYFYVTDKEGIYKGVVAMDDLRQVILDEDILENLVIAKDIMNDDVPFVDLEYSLDRLMRRFGTQIMNELPVVDEGGKLLGVVTRRALISAYNSELLKRDAVNEVLGGISTAEESQMVMLAGGVAVCEVEAPGWMVGKTLAELNLRQERGIQVMLINSTGEGEAGGEPLQLVPQPDYVIQLGDNLVVCGKSEAIQTLKG